MILLLIPLAGVAVGVGLWGALRAVGSLNLPGADAGPRRSRAPRAARERPSHLGPLTLSERTENIPQGCLIAVLAVAGIWILGWLIVLIVGLSYLS